MEKVKFSSLKGKVLGKIKFSDLDYSGRPTLVEFETDRGFLYQMFHDQECCEEVYLEDINGDVEDILYTPILQAEESSGGESVEDSYGNIGEWTFYRLATVKGYLVLRWFGFSETYSIDVDLYKL